MPRLDASGRASKSVPTALVAAVRRPVTAMLSGNSRAGDLADDDAFEFAFGGVVEHDDRMIEARINLFFGHRLDPFAMRHQAGGFGRGHAALMHADAHAGGNMNAPARRIELRVLAPLAKSHAHGFDGFGHGDDASNFLRADEHGLHVISLE